MLQSDTLLLSTDKQRSMATSVSGSLSSSYPPVSPPIHDEAGTTTRMSITGTAHQLPERCVREILFFAARPVQCPRRVNPDIFPSGFSAEVIILDQAHSKLEQLTGLIAYSQVSKCYQSHFRPKIDHLSKEITSLFREIHGAEIGTRCLREIVATGQYLRALKIYIEANPEAIWNGTTPKSCHTLLHVAVSPDFRGALSVSFIKFLLEKIFSIKNLPHQ